MENYIARVSSWNPAGKFIILFNNRSSYASATTPLSNDEFIPESIAQAFFELLFKRYNAANVIVSVAMGVSAYNIYKSDPYGNTFCGLLNFSFFNLMQKKNGY